MSKYLYLDASYFLCQTDIHWSLVEYSSSYSSSSEHQIFFVCVVSLSEKCPEWLHLIITLRLYLIIVNGLTSDILSDQYLSEVINKTILSSHSFILSLAFKQCIFQTISLLLLFTDQNKNWCNIWMEIRKIIMSGGIHLTHVSECFHLVLVARKWITNENLIWKVLSTGFQRDIFYIFKTLSP